MSTSKTREVRAPASGCCHVLSPQQLVSIAAAAGLLVKRVDAAAKSCLPTLVLREAIGTFFRVHPPFDVPIPLPSSGADLYNRCRCVGQVCCMLALLA
jgi:hypothetical protein